ncbi:MAG: site-specific DNA-methyltransferase [Sulfurimonas sp.]|nr:site-specific DNA-methyltransferase [Sulfurimonas sp.]
MQELDGKSLDIVSQNIEKIKELFPEVFSEGKINFAKLQEELGTFAEDETERYNFTWAGKSEAKRIAQTPSTGTLRPCQEESKDWDSTQNLYIEGDNLEVLKLLQKSYHKQVKMIYIDPPYNTGKDFVYKDNFKDNIKNYLEITGQVDSDGNRLSTNSDTNGRYHSDWLSMMYPRLKLARNLLRDDGVILIHIDEHEYTNLEKLCNEIFGEDNNLGSITWDKRNPKGDSKGIAYQDEKIIIFAKNKEFLTLNHEIKRKKKNAEKIIEKANLLFNKYKNNELSFEELNNDFRKWINLNKDFSGGEKAYNKIDSHGDVFRTVSMAWPNNSQAPDDYLIPLIHPITNQHCPIPEKGWRNPSSKMKELLENDLIIFGIDESKQPERKYLLKENMTENIPSVIPYGGSDDKLFKELNLKFDNPKPFELVKDLIEPFTDKEEIILDFFSGSATTAHAVMNLNCEDGGNRKYIMVQLPEPTDNKEFPTICEIGKERIRRAGEKIIGSEVLTSPKNDGLFGGTKVPPPLDIGFKVLKLDSSNIKTWDSNFENLEQNLLDSVENIKSDRTPQDLLYEILLKYGLDLTLPIEEKTLHGKKVFVIGYGALIVCLDDAITLEVVEAIAKLKDEYKSEITRVVFKDSSFADAVVKTNALQVLKQFEIDEVVSV